MRLNPDCIRDILLCVEAVEFDEPIKFSDIVDKLDKYETEEVLYHINQCEYNHFFTKINHFVQSYNGMIFDLTPKAHEFLANIRSDTIWKKTKSTAAKVGSFALPALQQIAATIVEGAIKGFINSQNP